PASLPAPPLEEWQGLSTFCDHFQCRLVGVDILPWPMHNGLSSLSPSTTARLFLKWREVCFGSFKNIDNHLVYRCNIERCVCSALFVVCWSLITRTSLLP
ncbi:unnamed protein product, partial [Ectocarpus sp. 12 AP-2014]